MHAQSRLSTTFLVLATLLLSTLLVVSAFNPQDVTNSIDYTANPCDDFYLYACGKWIADTQIPPSENRYSRSFTVIARRNDQIMKGILTNPDRKIDSTLKDFYKSCTDVQGIEKAGIPNMLQRMYVWIDEHMSNMRAVANFAALAKRWGVETFFETSVLIDAKEPSRKIIQLSQGGLALPDRDYYLDTSDEGKQLLAKYQKHIENMFNLLGVTGNNNQRAADVMKVEKLLARIALPGDELRDPFKTYNLRTIAEVKKGSPVFDWDGYFDWLVPGMFNIEEVTLTAPTYFADLSNALRKELSMAEVGNYLRWRVLQSVAVYLPQKFRDETFDFFDRTLGGKTQPPARDDFCVGSTDETMGMLLGREFVKDAFSEEAKQKGQKMIQQIWDLFHGILDTDDWMDATTRQRAQKKLTMMGQVVGYPDKWPVYTGLNITSSDYFTNKMNGRYWTFMDTFAVDLQQPTDRNKWEMTPPTVNAYYEPSINGMVIPAGIMQPPFFSLDQPDAMNFGGMGLVVAHENSHGFDDQGRLYDGAGKLENWWTDAVNEKFQSKVQCLVDQYNKFSPLPGYFVNGRLTAGENIADNAGAKTSFRAFAKQMGNKLDEQSPVPGFSHRKLFFIGFAQTWCEKVRPEAVKARLLSDVHSPGRFRVVGPLQNLPEFAQAFNCPAGSNMVPKQRCDLF